MLVTDCRKLSIIVLNLFRSRVNTNQNAMDQRRTMS